MATETRLTSAQRRKLEALRRRLDDHRAKEAAILVDMGAVAGQIYGQHPHFTKGLTAELVAALGVSRNHLYRLMDQAKLAGALHDGPWDEPRPAQPTAATATGGPEFRPPEQRGPAKS